MTGRQGGYCAGYNAPGFANPGPRMGVGWGMGRGFRGGAVGGGRGWRNRFYATGVPGWQWAAQGYAQPGPAMDVPPAPDPEMEMRALLNRADALLAELTAIKQRLSVLEGKDEPETE